MSYRDDPAYMKNLITLFTDLIDDQKGELGMLEAVRYSIMSDVVDQFTTASAHKMHILAKSLEILDRALKTASPKENDLYSGLMTLYSWIPDNYDRALEDKGAGRLHRVAAYNIGSEVLCNALEMDKATKQEPGTFFKLWHIETAHKAPAQIKTAARALVKDIKTGRFTGDCEELAAIYDKILRLN